MTETTTPQKDGFTVWESRLVGEFGLSRKDVAKLRKEHLVRRVDWTIDRKRVVWTEAAVKKAAQILRSHNPLSAPQRPGQANEASDTPEVKKGAQANNGAHPALLEETLTVVSFPRINGYHFTNKRVIRAARKNGEQVIVIVGDSRNFCPRQGNGSPMSVRARLESGSDYSRWVLVGRRPRYKGRY